VLQAAPFSTTGHNGKSKGKEDGDEASNPSAETEAGEGAVSMLKSLEKSSKNVLKRFKALTSSESTAKEGKPVAAPKLSQSLRKKLRQRGLFAKDLAGKTPTEIEELRKANLLARAERREKMKAALASESNKGEGSATESKEPMGEEQTTKSTVPTGHGEDGNQDQELMAAMSTMLKNTKSKKTPSPERGRKKGKAAVKPSPAEQPKKAAKTAVAKKGKPAAKEARKPGEDVSPAPVANIEDQVNKLGESEARNALISAIQGKAKSQPSDATQDEVLKNLQKSVTSKLPAKSPAKSTAKTPAKSPAKSPPSKQRSSKKLTQTIKDAMQKPSLRKARGQPNFANLVRMVKVPNQVKRPRRTRNIDKMAAPEVETISAADLKLVPINEEKLKVPSLSYGLERVLFNPGVYHLQDPRSRVFNFDPYLQTIMPVSEFDFTLLKKFITSSRDDVLLSTAKAEGKKYTGSTSSMTSALSHFHYLLSQWRKINPGILSRNFPIDFDSFTQLQRAPTALFLRYRDGTYAIDADKEYDTANVLSMLGQSMEKLLTLSTEEFEQYRKHSGDPPSEEARNKSESYHYTTMGDFLMRSQLDAHDPRIPGTGMFDLKTRAVVSIRMDTAKYEHGSGYEIRGRHGEWESFEREYYDMIRAAFLKYSLQVRMGRMDGIFVAFHNTERIFGFQYISLPEMDYALHGTDDTTTGDSEFKLSLSLLNRVLDRATTEFPKQSLRLFFETRARTSEEETPYMYIFAEPVDEKTIEEIQASNKDKIEEFERTVLGIPPETEAEKKSEWESIKAQVEARIEKDEDDQGEAIEDKEDEPEDDVSREIEEEIDRDHYNDMEELAPDTEHVLSEEVIDEDALNDEQENEVDEEPSEVEAREEEALESEENAQETVVDEDSVVEESVVKDSAVEDPENVAEIESSKVEGHAEEVLETEDNGKAQAFDEEGFLKWDETESRENPAQATGEEDGQTAKDAASEKEASLIKDAQDALDEFAGRPILGMYLTIRNKVNGRYVKRTSDLKKDDNWKVEYALANIPDRIRAHKLQETSKLRRAKALNKKKEEEGRDPWNERYIENIRRLSSKGRDYRRKLDEIEKEVPVKILEGVVFGRESKNSASPGEVNREVWTEDGRKEE
jgi:hypothetical protein